MSAATSEAEDNKLDYRTRAGGPWTNAWKVSAGVAVLGLVGVGIGWATNAQRFAWSYLVAFFFFLTIALGATFFVLMQHLTSAGWSVTVRRTAEFFMSGLWVFALLVIPLLANAGHVYRWMHPPAAAEEAHHEAGAHGAHAAHAEGDNGMRAGHGREVEAHRAMVSVEAFDQEAAEREEYAHLMQEKHTYLNVTFFLIRAALYFLAWIWMSRRMFGLSVAQDDSRDPQNTVKLQRMAPGATALFGLTLTFAAFDWVMSLNPTWYSTIFGVTIFAGSILTAFAVIILVALSLRRSGLVGNAINVEHFHDLGKLMFGFLVFWAYVNFAQYFLIWYAGIPEETTFYHHRWGEGPWRYVSLAVLFGHFVVPFAFLLSRNTKRRLPLLAVGAAWIIAMHLLEMYWLVMPNYNRHLIAADADSVLTPHWLDLACLLFVGGTYLTLVFRTLANQRLIPVGDPRLHRALRFENF